MQRGYLSQMFHALDKGLDWWFGERRAWVRDYRKLSKGIEQYSDRVLADTMPQDEFIRIGDMRRIFDKISGRLEYRHSYDDFQTYVEPVFTALIEQAERGDIPCHIYTEEDIKIDGRFRVRDILAVLEQADLPEGGAQDMRLRTETIFEAATPDIDTSTDIGRLQAWFHKNLPMRTPSTDVTEKQVITTDVLNLKRPLIMALGYAADYHNQASMIRKYDVPRLEDIMFERNNFQRKLRLKATEPRYYRGHRID